MAAVVGRSASCAGEAEIGGWSDEVGVRGWRRGSAKRRGQHLPLLLYEAEAPRKHGEGLWNQGNEGLSS